MQRLNTSRAFHLFCALKNGHAKHLQVSKQGEQEGEKERETEREAKLIHGEAISSNQSNFMILLPFIILPLRVQVHNSHILAQKLCYNYYYPTIKALIIGYLDPLGSSCFEVLAGKRGWNLEGSEFQSGDPPTRQGQVEQVGIFRIEPESKLFKGLTWVRV